MKDFKQFLKEFKELNPKMPRSELEKRAKDAYQAEKKRQRAVDKDSVVIVRVPSVRLDEDLKKGEKKDEKKDEEKKPEKTPEEIAKEKAEAEEAEKKKIREKNVKKLIELWDPQLKRIIEEKPYPQFPLHPETRRLATPSDLYAVMDAIQEDEMSIEPPALLRILISDNNACINCYKAYQNQPVIASEKMAEYFQKRGIQFHPELQVWQSPMLPPLRREFISYCKDASQQFTPMTIDLEKEIEEKIEKGELDDIVSLNALIELIKKNPEILGKVSDHELMFYGLSTGELLELRQIAGEKSKKKRNKMLKEWVDKKTEDPKAKKENKSSDFQEGGGKKEEKEEKKVKRDLALYASMII